MEVIDCVADFKKLVNPDGQPHFAGAALVKRLEGLCTLRPCSIQSHANFMGTTSNLHFRIAIDPITDRAAIQNKQTTDVQDWSPVEYVWTTEVSNDATPSMFRDWLQDLKAAESVPITEKRSDELHKFLKLCGWRLNPEHLLTLFEKVRHMEVLRIELPLHWREGGQFTAEHNRDDDDDYDEPVYQPIMIRDSNCIILNRAARVELQGESLANPVQIGNFIAYRPFYTDDISETDRKPIYVGVVTALLFQSNQVQIKCYRTPNKAPLSLAANARPPVYSPFRPIRGGSGHEDVRGKDIFCILPVEYEGDNLPSKVTLTKPMKRQIMKVISAEAIDNAVAE